MSKAHMPHWRYVAVHLEGEPAGRRSLQTAITQAARAAGVPEDRLPNVTRFEWPHAIIRFRHMDVDTGRAWLASIHDLQGSAATVTTMKTSGTIKSLTDKLGILTKR